jgi:hypothetical protein
VDPVIARITSSSQVLFADGFGQRRLGVGLNGDHFEVLTFRDEINASVLFETALCDSPLGFPVRALRPRA